MTTQCMEGSKKGNEKNVQWKWKDITSIVWVRHEAEQMGRGKKGDACLRLPLVESLQMCLDSAMQ